MVVEEELSADPVGAGIDFRLKMVHALECVGRIGVAFGKTRHPDLELMPVSLTERLNVCDEVGGEVEVAFGHFGTFRRWITA